MLLLFKSWTAPKSQRAKGSSVDFKYGNPVPTVPLCVAPDSSRGKRSRCFLLYDVRVGARASTCQKK